MLQCGCSEIRGVPSDDCIRILFSLQWHPAGSSVVSVGQHEISPYSRQGDIHGKEKEQLLRNQRDIVSSQSHVAEIGRTNKSRHGLQYNRRISKK